MCLFGKSKNDILDLLAVVEDFSTWAGLSFNIRKCGILSLKNSGGRKYVENFLPTLGTQPIPALKWEDTYKYLGVSIGREPTRSLNTLGQAIIKDVERICKSNLTDWQKIDAVNTFIITKADFALQMSLINQKWCKEIDAKIRTLVKQALGLPKWTSMDFLYAKMQQGGRGLISIEDNRHQALITQCYRVLTSPDKLVQEVAWSQLRDCVSARTGKPH